MWMCMQIKGYVSWKVKFVLIVGLLTGPLVYIPSSIFLGEGTQSNSRISLAWVVIPTVFPVLLYRHNCFRYIRSLYLAADIRIVKWWDKLGRKSNTLWTVSF